MSAPPAFSKLGPWPNSPIEIPPTPTGRSRSGATPRSAWPPTSRSSRSATATSASAAPGGGRAVARRRRDPQRAARDVADRLSRGRPRAGPRRPDDRQRHRRLDRPPVRRRRAVLLGVRRGEAVRARARHGGRRAEPRGGVGDLARPPRADPLTPPRVARGPPSRGHRLRGGRARRARQDHHLVRARHPRSRGGRGRPAAGEGFLRAGARARVGPRGRPPRRPRPHHPYQRAPDGVRDGSPRRGDIGGDRRRERGRRRRRGRPEAELEPGQSLRLSKYVAYHWAPRRRRGDLVARVDRTLDRAGRHGYESIETAHRDRVAEFWARSDIELSGAPDLQRRALQPLPAHAGHRAQRGPRGRRPRA